SEEPMSAKALKGRLLERGGLTQKRFSAATFWMGLRLRTAQERATHGGMVDAGGSPRKLSQQRSALEKVSGNPTSTHHSTMLTRRGLVSPAEPGKAVPGRQREISDIEGSNFPPEPDSEVTRSISNDFPEEP